MQLISPNVSMYDPMKDKTFRTPEVIERFGVPPEKVTEVMGLCGDTSDNIPGVPGIGEKTAAKLIAEFGSIEELLKNVEQVKQKKIRENLGRFSEQARVSRELATLKTQIPVPWGMEGLKAGEPDARKLHEIFKEMEFTKLLKEFTSEPERREDDYRLVLGIEAFSELLDGLKRAGGFALDLESTSLEPMRAEIVGLSFSYRPHQAFYIPVGHSYPGAPEQLEKADVLKALKPILEDPGIGKYGQNIKYDYILLAKGRDPPPGNRGGYDGGFLHSEPLETPPQPGGVGAGAPGPAGAHLCAGCGKGSQRNFL